MDLFQRSNTLKKESHVNPSNQEHSSKILLVSNPVFWGNPNFSPTKMVKGMNRCSMWTVDIRYTVAKVFQDFGWESRVLPRPKLLTGRH